MLSFYEGISEKQRKFQLYTNIKGIADEKVQDLAVGKPEFEALTFKELREALFERLAETSDPATDWAQFKDITQDSEEPLERYFENKKRAFEVAVRRNEEEAKSRHFELIQYAVSGIKHAGVKRKAVGLEAETPPLLGLPS